MKKLSLAALAAILSLVILSPFAIEKAAAAPILATELLEDPEPFELFHRDLTRTLSNSEGFFQQITNDAAIIASNNVDNDFGIWNNENVTYRHNLTWLNPAAGSFLNATLTILGYGVDGGNDRVIAESINLGNLVSDGAIIFEGFTTTVFGSSNAATLNALFADGYLNITISKNFGALLGLDSLSVYSSKLDVAYEPVPEPATMLLLGSSLVGFAVRKRRSAI